VAVVVEELVATVVAMEEIEIKEPPETTETNPKAKPMTTIGALSLPAEVIDKMKISKVLTRKNFRKLVTLTIYPWDQPGQVGEKAPAYMLLVVQNLKTVSQPQILTDHNRVDPAIILPIRINKPVAITNPANLWAAILTETIPEMSRDRKPWILPDNDLVILMVQPIM
jgi:hypothetical protein